MLPVPGSRVVTVSSQGHRIHAAIHFDDLQWERRYNRVAYGQAKLANLLFTYELQRRLGEAGKSTIAVAAHPGGSNTELTRSACRDLSARRYRAVAQSRDGRPCQLTVPPPIRPQGEGITRRTGSASSAVTRKVVQSSAQSHDKDLLTAPLDRLRRTHRRQLPESERPIMAGCVDQGYRVSRSGDDARLS